ncbi:hypothetical protein [Spirosoma agri]|jgi:hypothetical protein|uniref:Uncharacterized protein n=1 Tax=Spirosoma agri TaxID=1987381 RepID=A0A6M0IHU9_9BACT|nr:hypothetical protein [Spirosoma agri]NEU66603.1 hypothetical protein [Spirosoma agri]
MNNYLVVYYNADKPTYVYTETVETARIYAMTMTAGKQNDKNDVLSIVEVATDNIVYYGKGQQLADKLNVATRQNLMTWFSDHQPVKMLLNWIGHKMVKSTV